MKDDYEDLMNMDLDDPYDGESSVTEEEDFNIFDMELDDELDGVIITESYLHEEIDLLDMDVDTGEYIIEAVRVVEYEYGKKKKPTHVILTVYASEAGLNAHFHFYKAKKMPDEGRGGGCIMLEKSKYFQHGTHTDTLNDKDISHLVEALQSPFPGRIDWTFWDEIVSQWNNLNPRYKVKDNLEMPPYGEGIRPYKEK
jgi:hypothetical protein